jgi:RNA polymerase sigma factor (sigma-70 family)
MTKPLPPAVASLLAANVDDAKDRAWAEFLDQYSRLLLSASRGAGASHDERMDHYAYVLGHLREDDFRRLRAFTANGTGKFTTWLVVVVRRMSIDRHRQTHGRAAPTERDVESIARRNLANHVVQELDLDQIAHTSEAPDQAVLDEERTAAITDALATLSTSDQLLLTLRFVDGHPPEKVGHMLGIGSRYRVYRRLKAVIKTVKEQLEERGIHGP